MRRVVTVGMVMFILDRLSKLVVRSQGLAIENTGISFSFGQQLSQELLTAITLGVLVVITLGLWPQLRRRPVALGLLWAGALSNLVDRFLYGGVIDWISYPGIPIQNNLADWAIVLSIILVGWEVVTAKQPAE